MTKISPKVIWCKNFLNSYLMLFLILWHIQSYKTLKSNTERKVYCYYRRKNKKNQCMHFSILARKIILKCTKTCIPSCCLYAGILQLVWLVLFFLQEGKIKKQSYDTAHLRVRFKLNTRQFTIRPHYKIVFTNPWRSKKEKHKRVLFIVPAILSSADCWKGKYIGILYFSL